MDDWVLWMVAAGVLAVGEMFTLGFFAGPIAIAAVVAAIVALAGGGVAVQWIVFTAVSAASLLLLRPIARRHLRTPAQLRTGTAALVGATAVVIDRVDRDGGTVRLAGERGDRGAPGPLPAPARRGVGPRGPLGAPRKPADRPPRAGGVFPAAAGD